MFKKLLLNIKIRSSKYKLKFVLIMTVFNYIKIKIITKKTQNGVINVSSKAHLSLQEKKISFK